MKVVLTTKTIIILLFCLALVGFAVFAAIFVKDFIFEKPEIVLPKPEKDVIQSQECVFSIEERIVRGNSLSGLIENGQTVRVIFNYYDCNEIKREDIVLYSYAGNEEPLIKIIKGIPGDKFNLQKTEGGWHILINNEILKNSEGKPYLISGKRYEMLVLYKKDYKGEIPDGAYLLLGNITSGAIDSTRFGLVSKEGILGKAEY